MRRRPAALAASLTLVVSTLLAGACARAETLGYEAAIEVMVLDGVDRDRATCIVSALEGELPLAKVTGLDLGLDDAELSLLAATSARCAPALPTAGLVAEAGSGQAALPGPSGATADPTSQVRAEIDRMVRQGLEPSVADCVTVRLDGFADPAAVLQDPLRVSEIVVDCRDGRS